ncbi:HNH endonuclease [Mycobacterium phage Estes]|uniref:HNH endonuclease n=2 Tax=Reyvirus TaxID=1623301 RepID=A0A7G9A2H0_9CAUD|nr:HNH endonuclease [Mycobacterium phage Estes]YP_010014007.1 HNH endonuclease [Mycobacterium phage MrMagoo]APQ42204.1 HNH endonuclease [Mycobacterium phage MrMagoo]ARM70278.1 HNH endonuclease [Mycobacterium phage GardenSalsa]QNL30809.1 HNH endonuclease [Mycobacterium phage Estes]
MPTSSKNGPRSRGRTGGKYERAKWRVLKANQICAHPDCRKLIDLDLKWPDPMSPTVNHIIPVKDLAWDDPLTYSVENLEPMHLVCNQRLGAGPRKKKPKHQQSRNWRE